MERKHSKLKTFPSFKPKNRDDPRCVFVHHRYVGLKDIIQGSSLQNDTANNNTFDSSNISIRNELVKHAASAYIQSATSLVNRDQPLLEAFWGKMINSLSLPSCCHMYFAIPLHTFFRSLKHTFNRIGRFIRMIWLTCIDNITNFYTISAIISIIVGCPLY